MVCGSVFFSARKRGRPPVVCSDSCRESRVAVWRANAAPRPSGRRPRKQPQARECVVCGAEFMCIYPRRVCGSVCRHRAGKLRKYGLAPSDFSAMLASQDDCCAGCGRPFTEADPPHIDHCHATGVVRGLLHQRCNLAIGHAGDDPEVVLGWVRYLSRHASAA